MWEPLYKKQNNLFVQSHIPVQWDRWDSNSQIPDPAILVESSNTSAKIQVITNVFFPGIMSEIL